MSANAPGQEIDIDEAGMSPEEEAALNEELAKAEAAKSQPADNKTATLVSQASNLRSIAEIERDLAKPIPARLLKSFRKAGQMLTYIHWLTAQKFMSLYAPGWSKRVVSVSNVGDGAVVVVEVTVPTAEGPVTRGNVGYKAHKTGAEGKDTGFGGAALVAERQAEKRAFADFGLARSLYEKD
jgi:hypothetical protein